MTVRSPTWLPSTASQTIPSEIVRLAMQSSVGSGGITVSTDLAVTANGTPNMTVNVAAGSAWIAGTSNSTQGYYFLYNDATLSVAIAASDPSNPRIDLIVAQIRDNAEDSSGSTDARIVRVAGTPAGSPVAPSTPASSIVLAQVLVGAGVTSIVSGNITDQRSVNGIVTATNTRTLTNKTLTSPTLNSPTLTSPTMSSPTVSSGVVTLPGGGALNFVGAATGSISGDGSGALYIGAGGVTGILLNATGQVISLRIGTNDSAHDLATAWTSYTPTLTNVTGGTVAAAYKLTGKTLDVRVYFSAGSITSTAVVSVSLPPGLTSVAGVVQPVLNVNSPNTFWQVGAAATTISTQIAYGSGNPLTGTALSARIEVQ